jgi:23S rRNA (cytosine1962-C5)-methyltransferase
VLNLFAYTGASTLAAAAVGGIAGVEVAHVDAAKPVVQWASRNAELSGLADAPIRWLVDDAHAFVRRELRRGRRYAGIVLDPPSYGHGVKGGGSKGRDWRLERDLPELLTDCRRLLGESGAFMLLTCHTTGMTAPRLAQWFSERTGLQPTDASELALTSTSGERLPSGVCVRWAGK